MLREGNRSATLQRLNAANSVSKINLAGLTMPTLVLWGEDDQWIPLSTGKFLQQKIPHSHLVTIPQCGHVPMEEKPLPTAQQIIAFLSDFR
jgi:pimeloyl-ACP methyl ester carboxylesterase